MPAFTTIATAAGLAATAASTGMSFANMSKQGKLQKQAEADAAKAMAEARKKLEVNYYDQLAVKKEPYELEREAALAAGAQAIEAGRESERGAASTAGRVQMAQNEQQRKIAAAMGQEMTNIDQLVATEDARLRDIGVQLDMGEAEGAQRAARDAQEAKAAATQQAMQGVTSLAQQGAQLAPLFGKDTKGMANALSGVTLTDAEKGTFGSVKGFENIGTNFTQLGNMNRGQLKDFYSALTPDQMQMLFTNKAYTDYMDKNQFNYLSQQIKK
jgi:hypothetical protein